MKIAGLQKLTLLDYPDKIACTVFLPGCNFKCPFCHNASLVTRIDNEFMSEDNFFDFLSKRKGILSGVCITGGEPTLQPDLSDFIKRIKSLGFDVKLDTNGYKPDVMIDLVQSDLVDYVAMDIKNSKEKYPITVGCQNFDISKIEESVIFLKKNNVPYEFRTTVVKELHDYDDFKKIGEWLKGAENYYLQCFKDSGDLISDGFSDYDENTMKSLLKLVKHYIPTANIRGL